METLAHWVSFIYWHAVTYLLIIYAVILNFFGFWPVKPKWPVKVVTPPFTADKMDILNHLRHRDFALLDRTLTAYETQAEENVLYELNTQIAFRSFAVPDESVRPLLEEWTKSSPRSYAARLALGEYFKGQGFRARGYRYANQTSQQQFAAMQANYNQAIPEVTAALELDPKLMEGYCLLMKTAMAMSDNASYTRIGLTALHQTPSSFVVREQIMRHLQPRWGGSQAAMARFADESQAYAGDNPELAVLKGYVAWDTALGLEEAGQHEEAIRTETEALRLGGDYWEFYHQRGKYFVNLKRWFEALRDFNRANRLLPQDPDVLRCRALALAHLFFLKNSLDDIRVSSTLDTPDLNLLRLQQWEQVMVRDHPDLYGSNGTHLY